MRHIIKNAIRITFLNSHKSVFSRSATEENTSNKNTSTRSTTKRARSEHRYDMI